ncbi:MAG TPA: urease accessory protein UreD [Ferrovibrio sp.]|uniref:urease accessory protein UreD n=1 Tax=Ferrovibrio sp. TaxID=1917215 RepID=UPI002ED5B402
MTEKLQRADGALSLRFAADAAGVTRLADLYQHDPCRALLPRPDPDESPTAVLITTAGGLTGGDRLRLSLAAEAGAAALCTPQAAEKIYRAADDGDAAIEIDLALASAARLEWLPQETILFDGARLRRKVRIGLVENSALLAGDITVFGRIASGERFSEGFLFDRWQLRCGSRLIWQDAARLEGDVAGLLDHPAGYGGAAAQALILYYGPDAAAARDGLREQLGAQRIGGGVTLLDGLLIARLVDGDAARLRRHFATLWSILRPRLGRPARMPRLWRF